MFGEKGEFAAVFVHVWLWVVRLFCCNSRVVMHVELLNPVLQSAFEHSSRFSSSVYYLKP